MLRVTVHFRDMRTVSFESSLQGIESVREAGKGFLIALRWQGAVRDPGGRYQPADCVQGRDDVGGGYMREQPQVVQRSVRDAGGLGRGVFCLVLERPLLAIGRPLLLLKKCRRSQHGFLVGQTCPP